MDIYPVHLTFDMKWTQLEVELNNGERWKRIGECLRCGKCCTLKGKCEAYTTEILNGVKVAKCKEQWAKPWQCKTYPDNPYVELLDVCGYSWEKI